MGARHMSCYWCSEEFERDHEGVGWWLCVSCRQHYLAQHTFTCDRCGDTYLAGRGAWDPADRIGRCPVTCRSPVVAPGEQPPSDRRDGEDRVPADVQWCEQCGLEFVPGTAGMRFCSGRCRAVACRRHGRAL